MPVPLPEVGEVRTWLDMVNTRHQGRVTAVDPVARRVSFQTAHGATATVAADRVQPAEPDVGDATARLAAVQQANRWMEQTLPMRLEDLVTGAWDALRVLTPDRDSDAVKIDAAKAVVAGAQGLLKRLEEHVAARAAGGKGEGDD